MNTRWHINGDNIIFDVIDADIIIVNLINGHYYSAGGSALQLWAELLKGTTVSELAEKLAQIHGVHFKNSLPIVEDFFRQLETEEIISSQPYFPKTTPEIFQSLATQTEPGLQPATFEIFSDIEELLLLDPIHEVDERGWPNAKFDG